MLSQTCQEKKEKRHKLMINKKEVTTDTVETQMITRVTTNNNTLIK